MNSENTGASSGTPIGKEGVSCTILAGDFVKLLLEERLEESHLESKAFNSLRDGDSVISIKLEPNNEKDIAFIKMCEEQPLIAGMKLTPEEWHSRLNKYIQDVLETNEKE